MDTADTAALEADAKSRLIALLSYCREISTLHRKDAAPVWALRGCMGGDDASAAVLHEGLLRRLQELTTEGGVPMLWLGDGDAESSPGCGAWMRLRRPDAEGARQSPVGQLVCQVYSALFGAHQEALREGRGAQVTVGVGIVRWQPEPSVAIDHPLVTLPADISLDDTGAIVVRMADAAQAALWPFPGIPAAQTAVLQIEQCARDYRLLGGYACPAPTNREAWAPLLTRAAHCLASTGKYVETPPKCTPKGGLAGPLPPHPAIYNSFVLWTHQEAAERGLANDTAALEAALRGLPPGALPPALGRLAGVYGLAPPAPPAPQCGLVSSLLRRVLGRSPAPAPPGPPFLYFGLAANAQQAGVVEVLAREGCAVLVGPPGTGKSQTICNVICHYLATGRRVLITSKAEPATEVLRQKLPPGLRELCVSLGSGDATSFRRLEGAVETLADKVAAAPLAALNAHADRLRAHVSALTATIEAAEAAEERWAAPHFEPPAPAPSPGPPPVTGLNLLPLHADHLALLGVASPAAATLTHLADTVAVALDGPATATPVASAAEPAAAECSWGPWFLRGVEVDPLKPPPAQYVVDGVRRLRRGCMPALQWGEQLRLKVSRAEDVSPAELTTYCTQLRAKAEIEHDVACGELPKIRCAADANGLLLRLEALAKALVGLKDACEEAISSSSAAAGRSPARDAAGAAPVDDGKWLFALLRHTNSESARRVLTATLRAVERLSALGERVKVEGVVHVPDVLLCMVDGAAPSEDALRADGFPATDSEVLAEVQWRAHPEQRGFFKQLGRRLNGGPSQTLKAELERVTIEDRKPATQYEWQLVLQVLEVRAAAAELRKLWRQLADYGTPPPLPTQLPEHRHGPDVALAEFVRMRLLPRLVAFEACTREANSALGEVAERAVDGPGDVAGGGGAGSFAPWLCVALQSPEMCSDAADKLRRSLRITTAELGAAERWHRDMLRDFERADVASGAGAASPLGALHAAAAQLGGLGMSAEEGAYNFLKARAALRNARDSLGQLSELKALAQRLGAPAWAGRLLRPNPRRADGDGPLDPCPADAARLWSACAAFEAIRRAALPDASVTKARLAATQRHVVEREVAVCELVAAAARCSLRASMSPRVSASLMRLVAAVSQQGSSAADSVRSDRYRAEVASSLSECASAVPAWIMPTWRISQCLPPEIGAFDLVVLDEASQSDITALPALLRGKQVLVVGDGKQVSPTTAFVSEARIQDLKASLLSSRHPYVEQLLPGRSIFDLAQTCFADARICLSLHFRCVPATITFSNDAFYHGGLQPRRLPPRSKRLEPAIIDRYVPKGAKKGKVNAVEAQELIKYVKSAIRDPDGDLRSSTIGIISLAGVEQARLLRTMLLDGLTDAELSRHRIVVGDPSSFQGDERDVILLSLVASPGAAPPQLGRMYEQRYNVALSRARDRMVLFRSLRPSDVSNPDDLKLRTIQFFGRGGRSTEVLPMYSAESNARTGQTAEARLRAWLADAGYKATSACSIGGSVAVAEDAIGDRRLCVCLDGGVGAQVSDWRANLREQRMLERQGWRFHRIFRALWLVDEERCTAELQAALEAAGVSPVTSAATPAAGPGAAPATAAAGPPAAAPAAEGAASKSGPMVLHPPPKDLLGNRKAAVVVDAAAAEDARGSSRKPQGACDKDSPSPSQKSVTSISSGDDAVMEDAAAAVPDPCRPLSFAEPAPEPLPKPQARRGRKRGAESAAGSPAQPSAVAIVDGVAVACAASSPGDAVASRKPKPAPKPAGRAAKRRKRNGDDDDDWQP